MCSSSFCRLVRFFTTLVLDCILLSSSKIRHIILKRWTTNEISSSNYAKCNGNPLSLKFSCHSCCSIIFFTQVSFVLYSLGDPARYVMLCYSDCQMKAVTQESTILKLFICVDIHPNYLIIPSSYSCCSFLFFTELLFM